MVDWRYVALGAAVVVAFLFLAPAPKGCGCAKRKQRLAELGGEVFGA